MSLRNTRCAEVIERRLAEFKRLGEEGETVFDFRPFLDIVLKASIATELAFCISTANSSAKAGIAFQKSLESVDVLEMGVGEIEKLLRAAGVRFHRRKAEYIFNAFRKIEVAEEALELESFEAREMLVRNFKGMGYKEASHFLRNCGKLDVAILDRHVLRWLGIEKLKDYVAAEREFIRRAEEMSVSPAFLDLLIWFEATGAILK